MQTRSDVQSAPSPTGTLDHALAHARRLLESRPALAAEQAQEILRASPDHPVARLILGAAQCVQGLTLEAVRILEELAREQPQSPATQLWLGRACSAAGRGGEALTALRRAAILQPRWPDAWRELADELDAQGDAPGADQARAHFLETANQNPVLMAAASALVKNQLAHAEALLRTHLKAHETDVAALRMLAEVAGRLRRYGDAQTLLARCLELAPGFDSARHNYALVLQRQGKSAAALTQIQRLMVKEPRNVAYRNLQAAILAGLGEYADAIAMLEAVLAEYPQQPRIWMSYGHALKTARRTDASIAAYRRAIALEPTLGEAYWSLANLKTFRFTEADAEAMRTALRQTQLADEDHLHFEFALGKALEDAASYAESFQHYARGNAIRARTLNYRADETATTVRQTKELYTEDFLAVCTGAGCPAPDPIFIVGLPRAGSTLIEQILASHSRVEGTMELPDLPALAREFAGRIDRAAAMRGESGAIPPAVLEEFGQRYLASTRVQRKTDAPYFIDKMPNNWLHVGLIHLILPNARIIDARRHPMACCFSNFKQHFARGQNFAYSLTDLGRYYRDYLDLMVHFDAVLPRRVHRVFHERLVEDTKAEVRRLLEYCGLPFEEGCLRFYQNERAVRTASSEQVRRPIYREGLVQWKHYEPWLRPLREALGPALAEYPHLPEED